MQGRCSALIDVENEVYTRIAAPLRQQFSNINITGEYVKAPASFPHVSIVEADNYVSQGRLDSSNEERFATLMYEVNVYSNKTSGKKSECKSIMDYIDRIMYGMNFRRTERTPVPNLEDASIYRVTARYRAETDGERFYRI